MTFRMVLPLCSQQKSSMSMMKLFASMSRYAVTCVCTIVKQSTVCNLPPQIRSQNLYLWSNWSVSMAVPRNGSVLPNCTYQGMPGLSEL